MDSLKIVISNNHHSNLNSLYIQRIYIFYIIQFPMGHSTCCTLTHLTTCPVTLPAIDGRFKSQHPSLAPSTFPRQAPARGMQKEARCASFAFIQLMLASCKCWELETGAGYQSSHLLSSCWAAMFKGHPVQLCNQFYRTSRKDGTTCYLYFVPQRTKCIQ